MDVVNDLGKNPIIRHSSVDLAGHHTIHGVKATTPIKVFGTKNADTFDTHGLVTLRTPPPHLTKCAPSPLPMNGDGAKAFIQKDSGTQSLYLIKGGELLVRALVPSHLSGTNDVVWLQTTTPDNHGFDYFVFFEDTTCGDYGRFLHVEAFPDSAADSDCYNERPDQGDATANTPPPAFCPREPTSGSGNEPDHPH